MREREQIEALKSALSNPADVAARLGLTERARRSPCGVSVLCPAHDEGTPSCSLSRGPDGTLRVRCFGCDLAGDIFNLVAAVERLDVARDFPAVLRRAAELAGVDLERPPSPQPPRRASPQRPAQSPPLSDEVFAAVVAPLLSVGRLDASPMVADMIRYLARRGVLDQARADGWAGLPPPDGQASWLRALREASRAGHGYAPPFTARDVDRAGLAFGDVFTHPDNCLCIPWRDPSGVVTNLQRRRLDAGEPRYVGARGRSFAWPYGVEWIGRVDDAAPVVFVEGAFDVLALRALCAERGEKVIVLGLPGLAGWRPSWAAFARGRVAAVALDADEAGQRDTPRIVRDLANVGTRRIERWTPPAKDWADYLASRKAA